MSCCLVFLGAYADCLDCPREQGGEDSKNIIIGEFGIFWRNIGFFIPSILLFLELLEKASGNPV